ncbi:MAG: tyrosine-type recombinase/integrase [Myxococcales bacterium]|nr:tyrosine-type recombinase/integrase [Myxococcales bacterium]MCB9755316.1 tyrosine-type recombinase/integrase [Myxococcales bacterium]
MTIKIRQRTSASGKTHWQADIHVMLPSGKLLRERRMAQGRSEAAALRWAKAREAHLLRHGKGPRDDGGARAPKLIDFVEQFRRDYLVANRLRPSTIQSWDSVLSQHLLPVVGGLRLDEIGPREVQLLKQRPLAASTTNFVLAKLGALLRQACEWGLIAQVPKISSVKETSRAPEYLSFTDYARLLEVAEDPVTRVIVLLGGDAGMRCGELLALRWRNVHLDRNRIHVCENDVRGHVGPPKGGRDRWLPMTKQLRGELESLERRGERVLWRGDGEPMSHSAVTFRLHKAMRRAGLGKKGPHTLRHTFCSHLAMRGVSAVKIQRLAGHAKLATTQIYMHLAPSSLEDAIEALGR